MLMKKYALKLTVHGEQFLQISKLILKGKSKSQHRGIINVAMMDKSTGAFVSFIITIYPYTGLNMVNCMDKALKYSAMA